jgi:hypothetical protein
MDLYRNDAKIQSNRAYIPDYKRDDLDRYNERKGSATNNTRWDADDYNNKKEFNYNHNKHSKNSINDIGVLSGNSNVKQASSSSSSSSSFLQSTSAKVIVVIGAIAGVCLIAGGAAGLSYYLGSQSKFIIKPINIS